MAPLRRTLRRAGVMLAPLLLVACGETAQDDTGESVAANAGQSPDERSVEGAEYCEIVNRRLSVQDCQDLNRSLEQAKDGVAAFNVPDRMTRDETVTIQLSVAFAPPDANRLGDAPPAEPSEIPEPEPVIVPDETSIVPASPGITRQDPVTMLEGQDGTIETYEPIVGRTMRATLSGQGFEVIPLTRAEQDVSDYTVTSWQWAVTPEEHGPRTLTLQTVVLGIAANGQRYELLPTIRNEKVQVRLTIGQQLRDLIEGMPTILKLLTAVLTAATALVAAFWGLRKALRAGARKPDRNKRDTPPPED